MQLAMRIGECIAIIANSIIKATDRIMIIIRHVSNSGGGWQSLCIYVHALSYINEGLYQRHHLYVY